VSGLVDVEWRRAELSERAELTSSKPLLATILILFGIGYTIDYNSMSPTFHGVCLADLVLLPLLSFSAHLILLLSLPSSNYRFIQQCTSNTTRTELIRVYGDECISMNWIVSRDTRDCCGLLGVFQGLDSEIIECRLPGCLLTHRKRMWCVLSHQWRLSLRTRAYSLGILAPGSHRDLFDLPANPCVICPQVPVHEPVKTLF
jgi:hypothetical protein